MGHSPNQACRNAYNDRCGRIIEHIASRGIKTNETNPATTNDRRQRGRCEVVCEQRWEGDVDGKRERGPYGKASREVRVACVESRYTMQ